MDVVVTSSARVKRSRPARLPPHTRSSKSGDHRIWMPRPASRPQLTGLARACSSSPRSLSPAWWSLFTRVRRSETLRTSHVRLFLEFA
jgi:hypothetical protein